MAILFLSKRRNYFTITCELPVNALIEFKHIKINKAYQHFLSTPVTVQEVMKTNALYFS
jgi:hypothetical protein